MWYMQTQQLNFYSQNSFLNPHQKQIILNRSVLCKDITRPHKALYAYTKKATYNNSVFLLKNYGKIRLAHQPPRREPSLRSKKPRRDDNLSRTKQSVFFIVSGNIRQLKSPMFVTLTFADNITDLRTANIHFRNFIRRFTRERGANLQYLCVPEFQKRGAVHYHVVFFNLGFYPVMALRRIWSWGSVDIEKIDHPDNVSAYITAYITKENMDTRMYGEKAFFCSRGLLRPVIEYDNLCIDKALESFEKQVPEGHHLTSEVVITNSTSIIQFKYIHNANKAKNEVRGRAQGYYEGWSTIQYYRTVRRSPE